jgi:hypothetical protein
LCQADTNEQTQPHSQYDGKSSRMHKTNTPTKYQHKDKVDQCPQPSFCKKNKLANAKGNYTAGKNMCIHLISTTNLSIKKPETA